MMSQQDTSLTEDLPSNEEFQKWTKELLPQVKRGKPIESPLRLKIEEIKKVEHPDNDRIERYTDLITRFPKAWTCSVCNPKGDVDEQRNIMYNNKKFCTHCYLGANPTSWEETSFKTLCSSDEVFQNILSAWMESGKTKCDKRDPKLIKVLNFMKNKRNHENLFQSVQQSKNLAFICSSTCFTSF
jgi:hypothetical protein